ncbi:protein lap1-like isoform X2 [Leptopilina boulardi]|uniref:protein lap1-like isoform X2 n=1 Tax=Leptopilina boulardi TaxID=63433 RepID=UPI0021F646EC|nr:protein lap1-like isoform X2 [Leptopilina boulardi]
MGSAWWQCTACLRAQEEDICELQLNHCNLYDVPPDVFIYERTLEILYLDANRIKDLPRPLFQCHELRVLSLSDNEVTILPPAIASLINLELLDLSKNSIKELPDSIKECKNLRSIDISVNPFERFPDAITHIVGLQELYINDAYIEYLPANFGRLSALRTLELRENNMMTLPKSMSRLVNLQRLDIGNNDFTELPEVVGDLINLTELWIDGNDIRRIPGNIEQLYHLNHFDCTMNSVNVIPSEIQGWRDVSIMNFSSNEIYELPDSLCYLRTIVTLKIDDNQLNSLPKDIGQMSNLEELIVTKNFLEYLPPSIGLLRKLHCLNTDNNYLRCLPPEIGSCTALSLLSLRSNNLTKIPPELGHLSSLRVFNLVNNCIKYLPVSLLNLTNLKALWLSDNQSQPLVPLQQEFNYEEDMMVLSCFMLPQKPRQDLEQMDQTLGTISGSVGGSGRRICFAAEVDSELPRQLHRAPTPYPKELRNLARHARNLHHQTTHDQKLQVDQGDVIKEAIVAKPMIPVGNTSISGTDGPLQDNVAHVPQPFVEYYSSKYLIVNSNLGLEIEPNNSEESADDTIKTVLATETNPEIREAKYIRNPMSEYHAKPATIADYVNSTWKPDEYSKTNTAKIVESEKFVEPYKKTSDEKILDNKDITIYRISDVPPVPPPYHIAAAFSKKAAFFQQLNQASVSDTYQTFSSLKLSPSKKDNSQNDNNDELFIDKTKFDNVNSNNDNENLNETNVNFNGNETNVNVDVCDGIKSLESENNLNQSMKQSKIPVLKLKNVEIGNTFDSRENNFECSTNNEKVKQINITSLSASPICRKKIRSSITNEIKQSDQIINNSINENTSNDNGIMENLNQSENMNFLNSEQTIYDTSLNNFYMNLSKKDNDVQNETNSGRSTPSSINVKSTLSSDGKPKFKWMFGPHKNANVLPVRLKKNPGLGFSIAGGIAGAETGIVVTKVNPDGPAQGTLRPGDKILEVDGIDFTKSDHETAVAVLRATGAIVSMMISRHQ